MPVDEPVFVCINSSEEMKREEQAIAGQLWVQGDRQMTASNIAPPGTANTRDSALLYAAAEAVTWNHASQPDSPRKGQRVIIFPKDLPQLDQFLSTCDPNEDPEDGHPIAYETILRESQKFETTPLFLREDCDTVTSDPMLVANVPEWLAKSRQVATGNRRRVLEDGADVMSSSDEEDPKMKPDEEHNMYTSEMDPTAGPLRLSEAEAASQRFFAKSSRAAGPTDAQQLPEPPVLKGGVDELVARLRDVINSVSSSRTPTPVTSDTEDQDEMSEDQKRLARHGKKKAAASTRAPADRPEGAKAPTPTKGQVKGQESPVAKATHPMQTRQRASGAGGLRPGGGSGQTETCVASGDPSKT
jgi:hypothetical protein